MKDVIQNMTNLCCTCLLLIATFYFSSCKKSLEVDPPVDKITAENVFTTDQLATSSVTGIYSQMMATALFFTNGGSSVYGGILSDELYPTSTSNEIMEFYENSISPSNSTAWGNFWYRAYRHIYHANLCIEGLTTSTTLSAPVKDRLLGEARFLRAFCYFYLVNFYGDVPLITSTSYTENAALPRTGKDQVWQQVIEDLTDARQLLPAAYATTNRVRPNKWAAAALLARSYLYLQNWSAAEQAATEIINSGEYNLEANPDNAFKPNSREVIWQMMPVAAGFNSNESRNFVPTTAATSRPGYAITEHLKNAFEPGDARYSSWVGTKTVSGTTYFYPFKFKERGSIPASEYNVVLRLAEVFLIRAEARIQQHKLEEGRQDLNMIRARAGLAASVSVDKDTLLDEVAQERRIELFAEWGHRWFDLKRTGTIDLILAPIKTGWQPTDALLPVYEQELIRNPALTQNPGY